MKVFRILLLCLLLGGVPATALAKTFEVVINDSGFNPAALTINKGDTVRWVNEGMSTHSVTSGPVNGLLGITNGNFDSGLLNPGVTFEHTFTLPGIAKYFDASDTSKIGRAHV